MATAVPSVKKFTKIDKNFTATSASDITGNDLANNIIGSTSNDIIDGGKGNDVINGGLGDDVLTGGEGKDYVVGGGSTAGGVSVDGDIYKVTSDDTLIGGKGNDTFKFNSSVSGVTIHGGTSSYANDGLTAATLFATWDEASDSAIFKDATGAVVAAPSTVADASSKVATDIKLTVAYRPGSTTSVSTQASTVTGYNSVDTLEFSKTGKFDEVSFDGIERIELASGVSVVLSAEALAANGGSQDRGSINGGFVVSGVAGGKAETLTVLLDSDFNTFTPASTVVSATATTYEFADFQLDDFTSAYLFKDVDVIYDARETDGYVRIDGSNDSEIVYGSAGADNATMRLGNDTYYGFDGDDFITGHGGADYLDGGAGDDLFVIGGFGSGNQGTSSKADDGKAEWINPADKASYGGKFDVVVGGAGTDTLRITTGIGADTKAHGTVVLNDDNFKLMEVVQVGATVGTLNVEDAGIKQINNHLYFRANSSVTDTTSTAGNNGGTITNVVVDASGVTKNGLRFEGNAQAQTFIGTTKDDVFVGNGGNDTLTGGAGKDTFVFGKVYEQIVTGSSTAVQTYVNTAFNLTGVDTITDFTSGSDKIQLNKDMFAAFGSASSVVAGNIKVGAGAIAADADDFLLFDTTTKTLKYDADGNGSGATVDIAILTGVSTISATDFVLTGAVAVTS